ncbi:MAG TPA: hypothetical protein VNO55_07930 [Polyangia bacterium]|nr:hypothetical protein [Polyangia bacterium]
MTLARPFNRYWCNTMLVGGVAVLSGLSCDGPGNTGKTTPDPSLVRDVPWLNGGVPATEPNPDSTMPPIPVIPLLPVYPPIASGLTDLGSQRVDCSPLAGLEFSKGGGDWLTGWFDDFEPLTPGDPSATGVAPGWSSYDDLTKASFHVPGDATWYPGLQGTLGTPWGMPAEKTPGPSCDGKPNNWVLHFRGGLFRKWGGGISHAFTDPDGRYRAKERTDACTSPIDFCPAPLSATATTDTADLPVKDYLQSHDFVDVAPDPTANPPRLGYEGIAFWARRGPEGQDRALVILTDKYTSSRLARENQKFCRRVRECHTVCLNGAPCSPDDPMGANPTYRCFDPKVPLPTGLIDSLMDLMYPRCGRSACTSPDTYKDPDFDGKACRPYSFPAADESGEYCWNENDTPPPNRDERCQDGWQTTIQLTPDWKFYTLPFSQFGQVGFGKRAQKMDLKSLDTIAFGATMGWADSYFDNVTFYRRKK